MSTTLFYGIVSGSELWLPQFDCAFMQPDAADVKWDTLVHSGVLFPPEYTPHGVKLLYAGQPVDLTPEQEEVGPRHNMTLSFILCYKSAMQWKPAIVPAC